MSSWGFNISTDGESTTSLRSHWFSCVLSKLSLFIKLNVALLDEN